MVLYLRLLNSPFSFQVLNSLQMFRTTEKRLSYVDMKERLVGAPASNGMAAGINAKDSVLRMTPFDAVPRLLNAREVASTSIQARC
jgi:hypothetical protein